MPGGLAGLACSQLPTSIDLPMARKDLILFNGSLVFSKSRLEFELDKDKKL